MRKILSVLAAGAALTMLTGCSMFQAPTLESDYASNKASCEHYSSNAGDDASKLKLTESASGAPKITVSAPITGDTVTTSILVEGDGIEVKGDQLTDMEYIGMNGTTGEVFQASKWDGTDAISQYLKPAAEGVLMDFCHALSGAKEGSTVGVVIPAKIAHNGEGIADLKVAATDAIVFVFKLTKVYLGRATGAEQPLQSGFPSIVRASNGRPGISMLNTDAPTEQKTAVLIKGHGAELAKGDKITVHYTGAVWNSKVTFDSSWDNGQPAQFQLQDGALIAGFIDGLVGQTVGSQIITVIPPDKGYGNQDQSSIPAGSTLVFVIDILGATK